MIAYTATPINVDFKINSVEVRPFSSNYQGYGDKMADLVKNNITREGYIKVVNQGGQAVLTGTISIGRFDKKSYHKKYEMKDKEGNKKVYYTYYYRKQLATDATYSLKQGNKQIAGGNLTENYDRKWSGENAAEARSQATSDDGIITSSLNALARRIVKGISPHQSTRLFPIPCSSFVDKLMCWNRPETTKLGAEYYKNRRYDQAEKYWQQTLKNEQKPEYKAEAHYLIGVLRVKDNKFADAFRQFKRADELEPGNDLYMRALSQAEEAKWNKMEIAGKFFGGERYSSLSVGSRVHSRSGNLAYHLTVNATPRNSRIRIMTIKPKYRPGIKVKQGKHKIEVTKRGYKKRIKWVTITDHDVNVNIKLKKKWNQETTTIERYPTIECRDRVPVSKEFSVKVSLTEDLITPQVTTKTSKKKGEHSKAAVIKRYGKGEKVALSLSNQLKVPTATNEQDAWEIEVELSAPAFNFRGSDIATITLPLHGDSDIARFRLTPKPIQKQEKTQKIYALLWHQGVYLARIVREVTIKKKSRENLLPVKKFRFPSTSSTSQSAPPSSTRKLTPRDEKQKQAFNLDLQSPDMTIYLEHHFLPNRSMITIHSKILKRFKGSFPRSQKVLSQWLDDYYGYFTRASQNIINLASYGQSTNLEKKRNIDLLKGFGHVLYDKFAPPEFKKAFWALKDKLGDKFDTIHIFTDDPIIPWELMIPSRGNEELDFLGIDFQIARWHISDNSDLDRPSQFLNLQKLFAIMPEYPDDNLASARNELRMLQKMTGFRRVLGRYAALSKLFKTALTHNSIIHFSGHGIVQKSQQGLERYAIKLEDGELDLMTFRGIIPRPPKTHPFFFFNACDVGQAHHVANFVEGWAPTVLEAGASGYIGGLWPLANKGATKFAERFYQKLEKSLATGQSANVADILRQTRQHFYENGEPTFLGYVYYGDPHFQLVRKP
jgi:tetratricopeptide (TPR) repeat protein